MPAILGALVVKAGDFTEMKPDHLGPYLAGTVFAFVSGLLAVYGVLASIRRGKFEYFGYYCMLAGSSGLHPFQVAQKEAVPSKSKDRGDLAGGVMSSGSRLAPVACLMHS